jgi:hypothetical protein
VADTAIFLGAGASCAEGAPSQGELFAEYFRFLRNNPNTDKMNSELAAFFDEMFGIDVQRGDLENLKFPTFEEALALVDLATIRKEAFRDFELDNRATSGSLRSIGQHLVFLLASILREKLQGDGQWHPLLINELVKSEKIRETMFVSTNYDILIDNTLTDLYKQDLDLDYGLDFRNFYIDDDWRRPDPKNRVQLYKPHGSLNWLYCPVCNEIEITPKEKGVTRLISLDDPNCRRCQRMFSPIIVPPTFYKDLTNVFFSTVWNRIEVSMRSVRHIIFCGYSFPDADIHIKYLLKRVQTNRDRALRFTVVNQAPNKENHIVLEEKTRYLRFLGPNVRYSELSFSDFAANPMSVW